MAGAAGGTATVIGLARFDPVIGVSYRPRAQRNRAVLQQLLKPRAGKVGQGGGQEAVQPPAGMIVAGQSAERLIP